MGILNRFKDIMSSNINALLDKAEDPEKMIDQCLRNLNRDLGNVKSETAAVMAEVQRTKRELDEYTGEMEKLQNYAAKAVAAGNDNDARRFLEKKQALSARQADMQQAYANAQTNADNMRAMHDKLVKDISELESKREAVKAKIKIAKTQQHINEMTSRTTGSADSINAFERMEKKANQMLDQANAMAELNKPAGDALDDLMSKYEDTPAVTAVDDELAALKASLGK